MTTTINERVAVLETKVEAVLDEMKAVKRALWGFAFSLLLAAITFAVTVNVS
jgi:hypothetical protein